jgi:Flp pilus assembly protein TadG
MKRSEHGQNLVETAIVIPILLLFLVGIVELGRSFNSYMIVANLSREGARTAARLPCYTGGGPAPDQRAALRAAVVDAIMAEVEDATGVPQGLTPGSLAITLDPDPVTDGCVANPGDPLTVTVAYPFPIPAGALFGVTELTLTASTSMAIWNIVDPP